MPTPAKLVAALLFAGLCWYCGHLLWTESMPEGARIGWFREILAAGGLVVGWKYIGRTATGPMGRGNRLAYCITAGIGGAVIMFLLTFALHSAYATLEESLSSKYTEVGLAAEAWMEYAVADAKLAANPLLLAVAFAGSAAIGLIAGLVGRMAR
ncbi:TrgA family protein [uncultured Jannaschia sp.]|uniref:TrgA family protein n=1 Tax=uncultured Jannaschia sp. TaxID=293347 RepID=UPI002611FC42|nr:TrgA family protein [uncultured Jannaschia sp.]